MPPQLDLGLVARALAALGQEALDHVQLLDARRFAGMHHPPLNPDAPALVLGLGADDLRTLRRVLLNQYPAAHPLALVLDTSGEASLRVEPVMLDGLAQVADSSRVAALFVPSLPQPGAFETFQETIAHLRAPEGCPWDRKQTHSSLRPYLLEETYEVLDALDAGDIDLLREELGDLLLQIVLHSQIAVDTGEFRMADILAAINEKIVRRHPHVWGEVDVRDDQDVKVNWDKLKQQEKRDTRTSRLDGVSRSLPALSQAYSYQSRAARVNFDWETIDPVIAKVHEELRELLEAPEDRRASEAGDLLFAVVNLARWLDVEPESALRDANRRFFDRFHFIEQHAAARGLDLDQMALDEMDALWDAAKANGL